MHDEQSAGVVTDTMHDASHMNITFWIRLSCRGPRAHQNLVHLQAAGWHVSVINASKRTSSLGSVCTPPYCVFNCVRSSDRASTMDPTCDDSIPPQGSIVAAAVLTWLIFFCVVAIL